MLRTLLSACLCLLAACGASRPPPAAELPVTPHTLYPLAQDNAWSYDVDTGDGDSVLSVARVVFVQAGSGGEAVVVQSASEQLQYETRPDGIYRPARGGYLLRAPIELGAEWDAGSGTRARVSAVDLTRQTEAGRFSRCVRVDEHAPSGARIETTYCPGVGPVEVVSQVALSRGVARVVARLRGYQVGSVAH